MRRGPIVLMATAALLSLEKRGLTNFTSVSGQAESLPFANEVLDVVTTRALIGQPPSRKPLASCAQADVSRPQRQPEIRIV